jgi:hypothetical protein
MIGRTRSRRLGAFLAGVVLLIAVAGCTVGTTEISPAANYGLALCTAGPGALHLRFEVLKSDAVKPLDAYVWYGYESPTFGWVWDGTKSTGPKQIEVRYLLENPRFVVMIGAPYIPVVQGAKVGWMLTALDANFNDVGVTCE